MPLLTLPNELLMLVLESVWPDDLARFSVICSRIQNLSATMMREHRKLKLEYSRIQIFKETVPMTLADYCTGDYRLAQYPKNVEIMGWDKYSPENQIPVGTLEQLCTMAKRTGLIPDHRVRHWFREMFSSEVAITLFLLPTLPNLEVLQFIGGKSEGLQCIEELANAVVESQRRFENPQALSKLCSLFLLNYEDAPTEFKYFLPFMQLASMKNIIGSGLDCRHLEHIPIPPRSSLVERLRLSQSIVPSKSFSALLGGFKALRSFRYSPYFRGEFDLRSMRDALLEHHRHTLQELNIAPRGRHHDYMGSLQPFTGLKYVKLTTPMLCSRLHTVSLVHFLPSSIEAVEISGGLEGEAELQFFRSFDILREFRVPNLRIVYVHGYWQWWPQDFWEPESDFLFKYKNVSWAAPDPYKKISWYGLDGLGQWTRFGNGLNAKLFSE